MAERAWAARPFASLDALCTAMQAELMRAARQEKLELIRAHPQLKGKLANPNELTAASRQEQAGAGLDRCSPDQMDQLRSLNAAYLEKFSFPFVVAVRGLNTDAIIARMGERLDNSEDAEFREALEQIGRIAGFRLGEILKT